jgi:poly-gamma-glutamate capsule biosynthesis protein CapA/YwtB (metallophosphatase superfamily)
MTELLWFVGGALTYQILIKILGISQIYVFFQEVHAHMLMMLDAAAQDLDTAVELKADMLEEAHMEREQIDFIKNSDEQAVEIWKTTTVFKIQKFIPSTLKSAIRYDNWDEMQKYLRDILKT